MPRHLCAVALVITMLRVVSLALLLMASHVGQPIMFDHNGMAGIEMLFCGGRLKRRLHPTRTCVYISARNSYHVVLPRSRPSARLPMLFTSLCYQFGELYQSVVSADVQFHFFGMFLAILQFHLWVNCG